MTCCFLDVDDFKCVNDRWGHMLGDDVLTRIGNVLLDGARSSDSVGRFGGDEFIVLLPETGIEVAADLAARLRATLRHSAGALLDQDISVSMGLAGWQAGETSREFLTRADDALLAAKAAGGGLALAGSDGSPPQSAGSSAVEAGERQAVEIPARSLGRHSA